jgi:hypothetical protein
MIGEFVKYLTGLLAQCSSGRTWPRNSSFFKVFGLVFCFKYFGDVCGSSLLAVSDASIWGHVLSCQSFVVEAGSQLGYVEHKSVRSNTELGRGVA